ncbi:MAG: cytochrome C [Saprospiraceae bacterium]|nr:cytochrome C [Saprospiraceae bacterium]
MFLIKKSLLFSYLAIALFFAMGCDANAEASKAKEPTDNLKPIMGINEPIPAELAIKGKVLISYSDCYICHKTGQKSVGPSFEEIARRYPANQDYIEMLARKIILGGNGSWGSPVMDAHPQLPLNDAKTMVNYIMSMKK